MRKVATAKVTNFEQLKSALVPHHTRLQAHPIYHSVKTIE